MKGATEHEIEIARREQAARISELEVALAAAWASYDKCSHQLDDYNEIHKEIVNQAQRALGGRELD